MKPPTEIQAIELPSVCLTVSGYCLSKHWFVLLSFFFYSIHVEAWLKRNKNCCIKRLVFSASCDVNC